MSRLFHLTPYPVAHPRNGGPIRARHTASALREAGHTVIPCAAFRESYYPQPANPAAVNLDLSETPLRYPGVRQVLDMTNGQLLADDPRCFALFMAALRAADADLVVMEEPWLWPALRRARAEGFALPPVIYHAHNVETEAKESILRNDKVPEAGPLAAEVAALEAEICAAAAGISATTEQDAAALRPLSNCAVVVASNGTESRKRRHLRGLMPAPVQRFWRYALFISSAHPPNAQGFFDLVRDGIPFLGPMQHIVIAGSVAHLVVERIYAEGAPHVVQDRCAMIGEVGPFTLDCLIENAACLLLPITYGGGSNLKTAEALLSGKPVIATSAAFRGFRQFADVPGVAIADDKTRFTAAMARALAGEAESVPLLPEMRSLLWTHTLAPLVALVDAVAAGSLAHA